MHTLKRLSAGIAISGSLLASLAVALPAAAADVSINIGVNAWNAPPPPLPVYEQPMIPGPGYIWTPGYWAINPGGYYWVPGTWVMPPYVGALWTPGYWGYVGNVYRWHPGYWGRQVGYYGGINYGFGYVGTGYAGGYWNHDRFYYNRSVNHIDVHRVTNVYDRKVIINHKDDRRISYHGGQGGVQRRPTAHERQIDREHRPNGQPDRHDMRPGPNMNHGNDPRRDHAQGGPQNQHQQQIRQQQEQRQQQVRQQQEQRRQQDQHQQQVRQQQNEQRQQQDRQRQEQRQQQDRQQQEQRQQQARQQQEQRQQQVRQQQQEQRQQQVRQQQEQRHQQSRQQERQPDRHGGGGGNDHGGRGNRDH